MWAPSDLGENLWADWNFESLLDGPVASWADSVGGVVATQATGASQPTKDSTGIVHSGGAKSLSLAHVSNAERTWRCLVAIVKYNVAAAIANSGSLLSINGVSGSADNRWPMVGYSKAAATITVSWSNASGVGVSLPKGDDSKFHIIITRLVDGTAYSSIDGEAEVASVNTNIYLIRSATNQLGVFGDFRNPTIDMTLKRVMVLQGITSLDTVERIAGWSKATYGTALPGGHPYFSVAPNSNRYVNPVVFNTQTDWDTTIDDWWYDALQTSSHVGEAVAPLIAGFTETFREDFDTDTVTDDDNGAGPFYAPVQDAAGGVVTQVKPGGSPDVWSHAGSAVTITMQKVSSTWYTSNLISVNRMGRGNTWNPGERPTFIEARFKVNADGEPVWPAMWLKNVAEFWNRTAPRIEIDLLESYYNDAAGHHQSYHNWPPWRPYGGRLSTHEYVSNYTGLKASWPGGPVNLFDDVYHTYGALFTPSLIIFTFDGKELCRGPFRPDMAQNLYLLLSFTRHKASTTAGSPTMEIDWVRVSHGDMYEEDDMARTKVDDVLVLALGSKRSEIKARIADLGTLVDLQKDLADIEAKLVEIDPTIELSDEAGAARETIRP